MEGGFGLTTFASDGRLQQVENALTAAKKGDTSIGMVTKDGIILASEKYFNPTLVDATSFKKVQQISDFIGSTYSGLKADFTVITKKARKEYQKHYLTFRDDKVQVNQVARTIADLCQEYTQSGGGRPFGVSCLYAGIDRDGGHLFRVDPSGAYYEVKANATGKNETKANDDLERRYQDGMGLEDGIQIVLSILKEGYDGQMTENNLELAVINEKGYSLFTPEQVKNYLN